VTRTAAAIGTGLALATTTLVLISTTGPTGAADAGTPGTSPDSASDRALVRLAADARGAVRVARGVAVGF